MRIEDALELRDLRTEVALLREVVAECDGICMTAADVGVSVSGNPIAYPHPGCPLHAPGERCGCGQARCIDCGPSDG